MGGVNFGVSSRVVGEGAGVSPDLIALEAAVAGQVKRAKGLHARCFSVSAALRA